MNILLISPKSPPAGGIATWTELYLDEVKLKKDYVKLINTAVRGKRIDNFKKVYIIEEIKRNLAIVLGCRIELLKRRYDIVHLNISGSTFGLFRDYLIAKISKKNSRNLVLHCHCDLTYMLKTNFSKILFKMISNHATSIFVLNSNSEKYVKYVVKKDCVLVPNFFKSSINHNINKKIFSEKIKKVLYVGHVVKTKGCDDILKVAIALPNIEFLLVGNVSKEIEELYCPPNVKFVGEVPRGQVLDLMTNSDIFLFPTHTEGFPNVILEAMFCQLPIITTSVGAIPDMIENQGGIFVDINNPGQIIEALIQLDNYDVRKEMGEWNKNKVIRSYDLKGIMLDIFKEYTRLLGEDYS